MALKILLGSRILLGLNAYKSVLFRLASFLLDIAVYKIFTYIAFRRQTFTSYLMFGEAFFQRVLYVLTPSHEARRGRIMVLAFIVFMIGSTFYDTMLWGLDFPGYVLRTSSAPASSIQDHRRPDARYIVQSRSTVGVVSNINLPNDIGEGLWSPGTNASLTGLIAVGSPSVVSTRTFSPSEKYPGPRIWLDTDGFSIALEYRPGTNNGGNSCPETFDGARNLTWACTYYFYGSRVGVDYFEKVFGQPMVWWDTEPGAGKWKTGMERGVNPWFELSKGSKTLTMRQVLTLTRGTRRHVFLLSAFKATMTGQNNTKLKDADMEDLVRRTWSDDAVVGIKQDAIMAKIRAAKQKDEGLTAGWLSADEAGLTLRSRRYQYIKTPNNYVNNTNVVGTYAFQVQTSSLRLLRSESLPREPPPFETCDGYFVSHATGGIPRYSTCLYDARNGTRPTRYLGQMDVSVIYIITDTLGKTGANSSARVLNETSWRWLGDNDADIDKFVISRGYIVGVDAGAVTVDTYTNVPAVSVLQLLLVLLPLVLVMGAWGLVFLSVPGYYQASFMSIVIGSGGSGYMMNPPDIEVVERERQVLLRTPTGLVASGMGVRGEGSEDGEEKEYEIRLNNLSVRAGGGG